MGGWFREHVLQVFLPAFLLVGILAMVHEIRAERRLYHGDGHGALTGAAPHSPGEYPKVFAFDPLEGLDKGVGEIHVPPPPLNPDYFPCSQCHDSETSNREHRALEDEHTDIVLDHAEENRWCLDCHDFEDRDQLHLANGEKIPFEQSYRLCGQCHGPTYRDWKLGIHGKRSGYWNGPKRYLLCVHCHSPHSPRFKPLQPLPPPVRPEFLVREIDRDTGDNGLFLLLAVLVAGVSIPGWWRTLEKSGQPGWSILVPVYNMVCLVRTARKPAWWILLLLIPLVNVLVLFVLMRRIARSFGKGFWFALGLFFFTPIFVWVLGYGKAEYEGDTHE